MSHIPVLLHEALTALCIQHDGLYLDCTFGRGGHSRAILAELGASGRLIGLDRDPSAVAVARNLAQEDPRFEIVHTAFSALETALDSLAVSRVHGILMDLGVSSPQLDEAERGFSFQADGPLDMRMDPTAGESAADWIARANADEIAHVLWVFGEERFSRRIARAIVEARELAPIVTTTQLSQIVTNAQPKKDQNKHPATRSFQGIRLHINGELAEVQQGLQAAMNRLEVGGRLAVISFHSLEDRLVKRALRDASRPPKGDLRMPLPNGVVQPKLKLVGKLIKADPDELRLNPRARSAVLRIAERTEAV
ncbi:MAG: 16S rRNA (cytosine(1402)-N(4))-methyltransferase RsmH [Pseudomonadota bacterium]|nr:16S rRNA (cytosine(1402)-N(4))-methyltransferase RsmH [Pseudomonadota bacterium]MEE2820344.1 16S rRNA (cytosine(1402)-N(4))-methyltransferase RsmH [Pseudomonadota bacterium]